MKSADPEPAEADEKDVEGLQSAPPGAPIWRITALAPGLYVVATPIGNLRDVTLRALDVLASADLVLAEDTRVSAKLLSAFGISARVKPYHDHNAAEARPGILAELAGGARIALISDAGTPLISDPGYKLVRDAAEAGCAVFPLPGASAPLAALAASGLPTDRFAFAGFPPPKSGARRTFLAELASFEGTLVFFEGPSRLARSLADMADVLGGGREGVVARELTKRFEEFRRGALADLAAHYESEGAPRGELVVLVGPPQERQEPDADSLDAAIRAASDAPIRQLADDLAARFGLPRRDVYNRALALRRAEEDNEGDGD